MALPRKKPRRVASRREWWTAPQALAWIVYGTRVAVDRAHAGLWDSDGDVQGGNLPSDGELIALQEALFTPYLNRKYELYGRTHPADAEKKLDEKLSESKIATNSRGLLASADVEHEFPVEKKKKRGRGHVKESHLHAPTVEALAYLMIADPRSKYAGLYRDDVARIYLTQQKIGAFTGTTALKNEHWKMARAFAERFIANHVNTLPDLKCIVPPNYSGPRFTESEAARRRSNLATWFRRGRPPRNRII